MKCTYNESVTNCAFQCIARNRLAPTATLNNCYIESMSSCFTPY